MFGIAIVPLQMNMRLLLAAAVALSATAVVAQDGDDIMYLPRDTYRERLFQEGNTITFCYNPDAMMAAFEQDVARAIGDALLVDVSIITMPDPLMTTPPLDHRHPLMPVQLFVLLAEHCSAFMGYALTGHEPDWLMLTRPYMRSNYVLLVTDPTYSRLEDVPYDRPVGARGMSTIDNRLINFNQARPEAQRWQRHPYYTNDVVMARVQDGTVGAGLVWEPALYFATEGDPEAHGFRIIRNMPFEAPPLEIGIATRSNNTYLNNLLSDAIAALLQDGTIDRLLEAHHLKLSDAPGSGG